MSRSFLLVFVLSLSSTPLIFSFQFHPTFLSPLAQTFHHEFPNTAPRLTSRLTLPPLRTPCPALSHFRTFLSAQPEDCTGSLGAKGNYPPSSFSTTSPPPASTEASPVQPSSLAPSSAHIVPQLSDRNFPPPLEEGSSPTSTFSSSSKPISPHSSFSSSLSGPPDSLNSDMTSLPGSLPSSPFAQGTGINTPPPVDVFPSRSFSPFNMQSTFPPPSLDWREYRARLAAGPAAFDSRMKAERRRLFGDRQSTAPVWAHKLPFVEQGCVLLSSRDSPPNRQSVIFVVHTDSSVHPGSSSSGAISGLLLGELCGVAGRASPRVPRELAESPLFFGGADGDMRVYALHDKQHLKGAKELISGVSVGCSVSDAAEMVQNGAASPMDFRFYLQHVTWSAAELNSALSSGQWQPVACSPSILLHPVGSVSRQRLWSVLHSLTS
eukprot:GHVS01053509.1.p1 GENE.GHVS01053509.1~~GHVS01053509.1.p1  ORF type:complete len:504 (-),score=90.80 GHVS01053509.1:416-1723(-)